MAMNINICLMGCHAL